MPSSITLTVSHLPTSTSFFLSALQPLEYEFRGRANNTIGFGSVVNPSAPADFWITQELPGVPAGAAHVAFQAPSKIAVQNFFIAALKAGGNIHGEPEVRDKNGYYSAAVIDFDGNSIEAVFRPDLSDSTENDVRSTVSSRAMTRHVSVTRSQHSRAPRSEVDALISPSAAPTERPVSVRGISSAVIESIVTDARSAVDVVRNLAQSVSSSPTSQPRPSREGDGNAILGTLVAVATGAVLHYAFTHGKDPKSRPTLARSVTEPSRYQSHHQFEGPHYLALEDNDYASTIRPARSTASSRRSSHGGQRIYATSFDDRSIPPSSATRSSQNRSKVKMIEAPPSSFRPLHPSPLSRSYSHDQITTSSHVSRHRDTAIISPQQSTSPRTNSQSQLEFHPPRNVTKPSSRTHLRPASLSEANLKGATTAAAPLPRATMSLHSRNREADAYPPELDGRSRRESKHRGGRERTGSAGVGAGAATSAKEDPELSPADSISQVSSVRSASTVRASRRR